MSFLYTSFFSSFRVMRRANEETHAALVKQKKETKRVKEKV